MLTCVPRPPTETPTPGTRDVQVDSWEDANPALEAEAHFRRMLHLRCELGYYALRSVRLATHHNRVRRVLGKRRAHAGSVGAGGSGGRGGLPRRRTRACRAKAS